MRATQLNEVDEITDDHHGRALRLRLLELDPDSVDAGLQRLQRGRDHEFGLVRQAG